MNKTALGKKGEEIAERFLIQKGFKIIEKNYRIRGGEIDIVAIDGDTVVYVEVKTRTTDEFGYPEESITPRKIKFLVRTAKFYRNSRKNLPDLERIDVISIDFSNPAQALIKHIKNAGF
jgi:putative endonuclease